MAVARRILILGPSGAGKSTLARSIGERLSIPVVHLDALYWNPGWVPSEIAQFRESIAQAAARDTWIMDGNYTTHLDLRLPRADAVIWLDLPRSIYFRRSLWRSIRNYGRVRDDVGFGCPERFELSFFKDWVWTYPVRGRARHRDLMSRLSAGVLAITLTSPSEVAQFESELPHSLDMGVE
ncbi:MAG: (d)CMP kinase [Bradyrhizobiaceae bacterium]|nr:(d)CMP kinase [Bradyrhizobiaceae bacterium]